MRPSAAKGAARHSRLRFLWPRRCNVRVLLIDDEPHIRQMMRLTLETAGYDVDEAADGEAGLTQFFNGGPYDAVVLDQKMPGLDGLETLKRLKDRAPDVCVLMATAFASIE